MRTHRRLRLPVASTSRKS